MHILASLTDCAYVIRMLDWFETASEICVVTEYAQGELFEILEDDATLPEDAVRNIAIQLVAGLRFLHASRSDHGQQQDTRTNERAKSHHGRPRHRTPPGWTQLQR